MRVQFGRRWPVMPARRKLFALFAVFYLGVALVDSRLLPLSLLRVANADTSAQTLPFSQNWANTALITTSNDWSGVPGIIGYRGDALTGATGVDPQTVVADGSATPVNVIANQTNPNTNTTGGIAEFEQTQQAAPANANPAVAFQGSGTARAPHLVMTLNTTGQTNIGVSYNLRDVDCAADNAVQPVALQYRVGMTGNYTNIPAGFVADASTGPSLCTLVTPVSASLPAAAENQPVVQVRVITTDAVGSDEWIGVDDISITSGVVTMPTLTINDVTQAEGNASTSTFTFTVSLNTTSTSPVTFNIATQDNTATVADNDYVARSLTNQSIAAGNTTYTFDVTVNGDTNTEPTESFFVNVTNVTGATLGDGQGVGTITNDEVVITPIYSIQGSGNTSPVAGQSVTTTGIVTGIKLGSSGGFYIQDASGDGNTNTSDGLFVFTGNTVPAGVAVSNNVQVSGTVSEFIPAADLNQKPLTELSTVTVSVLSTGNPLPAPVQIMAADTLVNNLENLERFEGMRVSVPSLTVVAPTQGTITEPSATVTSNGVFYAVVTGVARPLREPGVNVSDPLPAGAPANVPRFDENPERLRVDSDGQPGTTLVDVTFGTVIPNVVGELDYSFRTYTILPETTLTPGPLATFTPAPAPLASELTIGSFNIERFFDTTDDPAKDDAVLTATAFNNRLNKVSLAIRNAMRSPDVIGIVEVENLTTLQTVASKINADTQAATGSDPNYQPYLVEGNDIGGIDVGFLVKATRVSVVDVTQLELAGCNGTAATCNTYINPNTGNAELLNDRPSLVLRATIARPAGGTLAVHRHRQPLALALRR